MKEKTTPKTYHMTASEHKKVGDVAVKFGLTQRQLIKDAVNEYAVNRLDTLRLNQEVNSLL